MKTCLLLVVVATSLICAASADHHHEARMVEIPDNDSEDAFHTFRVQRGDTGIKEARVVEVAGVEDRPLVEFFLDADGIKSLLKHLLIWVSVRVMEWYWQ